MRFHPAPGTLPCLLLLAFIFLSSLLHSRNVGVSVGDRGVIQSREKALFEFAKGK
jgi:hypothetical protein